MSVVFQARLYLVIGFVVAAIGSFVIAASAQESETKVIARINGMEITEKELALAEADLQQQFAQVPADERRAAVLNALIDIKLLEASAVEAGLDQDENFMARMAFARARALHNQYFQKNGLEVITEDELKARYDAEISQFPSETEISARHILLETEEAAKAVIAELDGGADFAELAKSKSTGPSGPGGGDLGYFGKGRMVPEFETEAFALEKGAYSKEPVKTQFGWHVIKKEDERQTEPPAYEDVKEQIRQILAQEKYLELSKAARQKFAFEILDEELKTKLEALPK